MVMYCSVVGVLLIQWARCSSPFSWWVNVRGPLYSLMICIGVSWVVFISVIDLGLVRGF